MTIHSIREIYAAISAAQPKRVAVAQAADAHVLQAVSEAYLEGYARPILIGDGESIRTIAQEHGIDISDLPVVEKTGAECAEEAVRMVRCGEADVVMKGLMESAPFLRAVVRKETGLRKPGAVVSAIAAVELKKLGRLAFITDLGITPLPDLETKKHLIENAVEVARKFGVEQPKVAALSAAETLNEKMVSSYEAARLAEMNERGEITGCVVAGPISFDLAMSAEAAEEKHYHHAVAGQADILLVPSIEVGNVLYKALMLFADMDTGGIIAGTEAPVVFCSRADSPQTKKNTLAMAVYLAGQKG